MKNLSNYETIQSFYDRLTKQNPKATFYGTGIEFGYGVVKFLGQTKQVDVIDTNVVDNWTFLNIETRDCIKCSSVGEICEMLHHLLDEQHGSKPILLNRRLIKLEKNTPYKPKVDKESLFHETDMNPFKKFNKEFKEVSRVLKDQPELILGWLKKKAPKDVQVYLVGVDFYIGQTDLIDAFPRLSSLNEFGSLFDQEDSIYTSKLGQGQFNLLFGRITSNSVLNSMIVQFPS